MAVTLKGQTAVYEGTSTDTKPTDADNNAIFKELDTGISYYYDGTDWNEIPSSGGGGGTGTDNYNELNNKPSINGTVLSGNKSLDNLGIQAKLTFDSAPTEDSENPVESGGVYGALAGKQDTISDLSSIRSGAAAGATAVQPAALETALAQKQDALSSEQLDAVNSGINSTDVEQIETNKNNILSLTANGGGKNKLQITATSTGEVTINDDKSVSITVNTSTQKNYNLTDWIPNNYVGMRISGMTVNSNTATGFFISVQYSNTGSSWASETNIATIGSAEIKNYPYLKISIVVRGGNNLNGVLFKPMISADGGPYQPYALSNAELTAAIQALQAQLANQ
jgi:hypothetical protein